MLGLRKIATLFLAGGAALLATGCGGPSRAERAMAEKDARIARMMEEKGTHEQHLAKKDEQIGLLGKANQELAGQNRDMANRNAKLAATTNAKVDAMNARLAAMQKKLDAQKAGTTVVNNGKEPGAITIRVANTVLFDAGRAKLKSGAYKALNKVAKTLKGQFGKHYVRVEGHTDRTPIVRPSTKKLFRDNMELSQARAKAVYDYLVGKGGVAKNRMYTAGYGYSQPVVRPEKTRADKAKNRRVDIVILPVNVKVQKESLAATE